MKSSANLLYNAEQIRAMIQNIAETLISDLHSQKINNFALIGIQANGVPLAQRIAQEIADRSGTMPPVGMLDINMYRDDIGKRDSLPYIHETKILFDLDDKAIILVDDVLQTGRTIRAALDALTDYGRPELIRLAVLIDRKGREYPIMADYAGVTEETIKKEDFITVDWKETAEKDAVYITEK